MYLLNCAYTIAWGVTLGTSYRHTQDFNICIIGDPWKFGRNVDGIKGAYAKFTVTIKALIQDQADILQVEFRVLHDELLKHFSFMQDELQAICVEVEGVCSDWPMHNRTLTFNPTSLSSSDAHRIDVLKPDTYDGNRNAIVMDYFFFELRHYFDTIDVRD